MNMVDRFQAENFTQLTPAMQTAFDQDGVLLLEGLVPPSACDGLRAHMDQMVDSFDPQEHQTIFSTTNQTHSQEDYFLSSGHQTRFFYEDGALDEDGKLNRPFEQAINKVGHAMHDQDPHFNQFSRQAAFHTIAKGLGVSDPLLAQSMYIFKQPKIGGEVICHQDATFIRSEPNSCLAFWVALEDATTENGCLWGIPGGHKDGPLRTLFVREGNTTKSITLDKTPYKEDMCVPLPAPKGTVIVFGGLFPHMSKANTSPKSRHAFTLHVIDANTHYPKDNWLQRPEHMPFQGF